MTTRVRQILRFIGDGEKTKKELLEEFGCWYYYNAPKHLGDVLTRMVKRGFIYRPKRGVYKCGRPPEPAPKFEQGTLFFEPPTTEDNGK